MEIGEGAGTNSDCGQQRIGPKSVLIESSDKL